MTNVDIANRLEYILMSGSGDQLIDLMTEYQDDIIEIMHTGAIALDASEDHLNLPDEEPDFIEVPDDEPPAHLREDGLVRARMEMQYDGDTDPEGGDLYDDRDNGPIECPVCGSYECDAKDCDGHGNEKTSEERKPDA